MARERKRFKEARWAKKNANWDYSDEEFTRSDWKDEVGRGDTQQGYFDWVLHQLESEIDCGGN
jgi:hypothetical protein